MNLLPKVLGVNTRANFFFISSHKNIAPNRFVIEKHTFDLDDGVLVGYSNFCFEV